MHCTARSYSTQLLLTIWQQHSVSSKYYIVVLLFGDCPEINRQRAVDSNPSSYRIGSKYYIPEKKIVAKYEPGLKTKAD